MVTTPTPPPPPTGLGNPPFSSDFGLPTPADAAAAATPAFDAAYGAARQAVYQAGIFVTDDQRHTLRLMAGEIAKEAAKSESPVMTAAGLGVSAGMRIARHWRVQESATADVFGMDPTARFHSWEGYHDGAF